MTNPNDYPSATGVRFVGISASVTMMVIWYGIQIPRSLAFINYYLNKPVSLVLTVILVAVLWLAVGAVYVVYQIAAGGRPARSHSEQQLFDDAHAVAVEMGLARIGFSLGENWRSSDMAAYGLPWKRRVFIQRGAIVYRSQHPEEFKARLCHELGHIKNGDIDTAVLSLAALYVAYVFIIGYVGFWTCQYVLHVSRLVEDRVALFVLLRYGGAVLISAFAWLSLLWLENRAFVREREFMADAEAAFRVGPGIVESALAAERSDDRRTLPKRLLGLTRVHPSILARRASLMSWQLAGLPSINTMLVVGAIFGLFTSTSNGVINQYGQHDKLLDFDPRFDREGEAVLQAFSNLGYILNLIFGSIFALLILSAIIALAIRTGIQHRMTGTGALDFSKKILLLTAALIAGLYLGSVFDPISLQRIFNSGGLDFSQPVRLLWVLAALFIISSVASFASGQWLMAGRRTSAISRLEWFCLALFFFLTIAQFSWGVMLVLTLGDWMSVEWVSIGSLLGMLILYSSGLGIAAYRIRNGTFRRNSSLKTASRPGLLQ